MSTFFKFGQYEVDIDVEKTRDFYRTMDKVTAGCTCQGCRNYEKAVDFLPESVKSFFNEIGADMKKITEVYVNCKNKDGTLYYGGFYHICGELRKGNRAWKPTNETERVWQEECSFEIEKNYHISFENEVSLLEKGFPLPVMQIEISANIPWVLEEECMYL